MEGVACHKTYPVCLTRDVYNTRHACMCTDIICGHHPYKTSMPHIYIFEMFTDVTKVSCYERRILHPWRSKYEYIINRSDTHAKTWDLKHAWKPSIEPALVICKSPRLTHACSFFSHLCSVPLRLSSCTREFRNRPAMDLFRAKKSASGGDYDCGSFDNGSTVVERAVCPVSPITGCAHSDSTICLRGMREGHFLGALLVNFDT